MTMKVVKCAKSAPEQRVYNDAITEVTRPPIPNLKVKLGLFNCAPIVLQSCSTVLQLFSIVLTPSPRYGVRAEQNLAPPPPLRFLMPDHLELIVLNCADIISSCAGPILRYEEMVSGAQLPICELWAQNGLYQLGFICAQLCSNPL